MISSGSAGQCTPIPCIQQASTFALPPPTSQSVLQGLPPCKPFWPDCMNLPSACADSVLGCCLCRPSLACNKHAAFPKETSCRREHNLALPTRQLCHCAGQRHLLITGHAQVCLVKELDDLACPSPPADVQSVLWTACVHWHAAPADTCRARHRAGSSHMAAY